MARKSFAFASDKVSIGFPLIAGLGDTVIAKKIFDAVIELAPDCLIDIFFPTENHKNLAASFFGQSGNLNLILDFQEHYQRTVNSYDLVLHVFGSRAVILDYVNIQSLQMKSPALAESVVKISNYNNVNVEPIGSENALSLRNTSAARVLGKNCYYFLSCGGALPIRDDKVNIPLLPEFKAAFDELNLDKYITIYTDISEQEREQPKVKTWPLRHLHEYVALMKTHLPQIKIVQVGGGEELRVENADRHFLSVDLELTKYILANSLLHVGCEGGLVHLATALGTKCLVLFGPGCVEYYGYARNVNVVSEICFPCSDIWEDGNTKFCARGAKEPPCMLNHTPQKVFELTKNYLINKA